MIMVHGSKYYEKHFIEEGPEYELKVNCTNKECKGFFAFDIRKADNEWSDVYKQWKCLKVFCPYCGTINRYVL